MKLTFVKAPVVHLIADTQTVYSKNLGRDMQRRGADVAEEIGWIEHTLPAEATADATEAESLCVAAGKGCYNAYGKKGSKKSAKEYLHDSVYSTSEDNPFGHLSIAYHPNFTFWISGISRRLSHELLRHYIGVSASQGAPSQMSSRYVIHPARFVVHPRYLEQIWERESMPPQPIYRTEEYNAFKKSCHSAYRHYSKTVAGVEGLKGLEKKRKLEAAAMALPMSVETTLYLTMNPVSARKMIMERTASTADLEFKRLCLKMLAVLENRYKAFQFR